MELNPLLANLMAVVAAIAGAALAVWWVVGLYWYRSRAEEKEMPEIELPGNLHEVFVGVPAVVIVFLVFTAISLVAYVLYIWLGGISY